MMQIRIDTYDFSQKYKPLKSEIIPQKYIDAGRRLAMQITDAKWILGKSFRLTDTIIVRREYIPGGVFFSIISDKSFPPSFRFIAHSCAYHVGGVVASSNRDQTSNYRIFVKTNRAGSRNLSRPK